MSQLWDLSDIRPNLDVIPDPLLVIPDPIRDPWIAGQARNDRGQVHL